AEALQALQCPHVHDQCRRHAEGDHVGQRIILFAECRLCVGEPSHPAVHAVEDQGQEDRDRRHLETSVHGLNDRVKPCEKVGGGESVGQQIDAAATLDVFWLEI